VKGYFFIFCLLFGCADKGLEQSKDSETALIEEMPKEVPQDAMLQTPKTLENEVILYFDQRQPAFIPSLENAGIFSIQNGCLVFTQKVGGKVGTTILPPFTQLSDDNQTLHFPSGRLLTLDVETNVTGAIDGPYSLTARQIVPPLSSKCPETFIYIGDPYDH